jgi:hypothetical protein
MLHAQGCQLPQVSKVACCVDPLQGPRPCRQTCAHSALQGGPGLWYRNLGPPLRPDGLGLPT